MSMEGKDSEIQRHARQRLNISQPKQMTSARRWIQKLSRKALTDVGYNITLDSTLRTNCDYNIRATNRKSIAQRDNLGVMEMREKLVTADSCSSEQSSLELQFIQAIDELRNFKESCRMLQDQWNCDPQQSVSWTHHFSDRRPERSLESGTLFRDDFENDLLVYENFFYGCKHWNFSCVDEDVGAIILSLKMELLHGKEYARLLIRSSLRSTHAVLSSESMGVFDHYLDPYSWIDPLTELLQLTKPLQLITCRTVGGELIKFEREFMKSEFKIGLLYVKHGQETEEEIFSNTSHSPAFESFLDLLGERVSLKGFTGYTGGLDTSNGLNGTQSVFTKHQQNKIMFHVSTLMPNSWNDVKHVGKKRHIGNDVLCVVFTDETETRFSPTWIKSKFIYVYIVVHPIKSSTDNLRYKVSIFCRDDVPWFGPYLSEDSTFEEENEFREWFLKKIINGDRACYKAPKFVSMQQGTRSLIINGIIVKEMTGQNDRSFDRKWLPSLTPSNSLDSLQSLFPTNSVDNSDPKLRYFYCSQTEEINSGDVAFLAGKAYKKRIYGVRSVMCSKSRVFRDILTDWGIQKNGCLNNVGKKEESLVKVAFVKTQSLIQNHSKKGKFDIETSCHKSPSPTDEYVTTISIKEAGKTYEISVDCIGRTREFIMNEFEADIFSGVIDFIHNDKCHITYETLPGLLCAATYYELPDLRLSCLNKQDDVLTVETVCPMLNILEEYTYFNDGKELQQKLLEFFVDYWTEITKDDHFTILSKSRIILVLSQDWKCEIKCKVRVIMIWAKSKDSLGWKSLGKSVLSSCAQITGSTMLDDVMTNLGDYTEEKVP